MLQSIQCTKAGYTISAIV